MLWPRVRVNDETRLASACASPGAAEKAAPARLCADRPAVPAARAAETVETRHATAVLDPPGR
jgi:hypothetical protein